MMSQAPLSVRSGGYGTPFAKKRIYICLSHTAEGYFKEPHMTFEWMKGSASNFGYVGGSNIRIERYSKPDKTLYYYLSNPERLYFHHAGPFDTSQDRDDDLLKELELLLHPRGTRGI